MKMDWDFGVIGGAMRVVLIGVMAAVIGVGAVAEAQQQGQASDQQQDDLFGPSDTQNEQLQEDAALQGALESQPPTGLEDQASGQPGALDQRGGLGTQDAAGQRGRIGQQRAADPSAIFEDEPMAPPRERGDMRRERQGEMADRMRDDRGQMGRGELGVFLMSSPGPGVEIASVVSGSAADEAGLNPGDVILEVEGQAVATPGEVSQAIRQMQAGQQTRLSIWRDGEQGEVAATLQPARDRYAVGFRGEESRMEAGGGDLAARQRRLEQQLDRVMEELARLRQDVQQLRGTEGARGAMPPSELDQQPLPPDADTAPPDFLDEPTGATEPPGFQGTGAESPRATGTVSGAAGTTPVEAGATTGPGVAPATTP